MAEPRRRRATYDDILALPEHVVGEIISGELIVSPRPASPHARASSLVGRDLGDPFDRPPGGDAPGGWWLIDEPELHLGNDIVVPDLAGWRRERMPKIPNVTAFELSPDWVCEIVSPSTVRIDRTSKMAIYARAQVPHLWLIDPIARTLESYRLDLDLDHEHWIVAATHAGEEKIRVAPFQAVELDLSRWWIET